MKKILILLALVVGCVVSVHAEEKGQEKGTRLFYIEKSSSPNVVCYDVKLVNDMPDPKKPIISYWQDFAMPEWYAPVTLFDKVAYGHSVKKNASGEYQFTLRASDKKIFSLRKHGGKWIAVCKIKGRDAHVTKMYVKMKSSMSAEYLDIFGTDLVNGQQLKERINDK